MREVRKSSIDVRNPLFGIRKAPFDTKEWVARDDYTPELDFFVKGIKEQMEEADEEIRTKITRMKRHHPENNKIELQLPDELYEELSNLLHKFPNNAGETLKTTQNHIKVLYNAQEVIIPRNKGYKWLIMTV